MADAIGLLGGAFDPVHVGHIRAAIECREQLRLDRVDLLVAADPPLKHAPCADACQRMAMAQLAVEGTDYLGVDGRERDRAGPSYTVDTLREWREEHGPGPSLVFLVGQDILPALCQWSRWESLLEFCHLAIAVRPGVTASIPETVARWLKHHETPATAVKQRSKGAVVRIDSPSLTVSSTAIRAALAQGNSVQCLLQPAVIEYIHEHGLYGEYSDSRAMQEGE